MKFSQPLVSAALVSTAAAAATPVVASTPQMKSTHPYAFFIFSTNPKLVSKSVTMITITERPSFITHECFFDWAKVCEPASEGHQWMEHDHHVCMDSHFDKLSTACQNDMEETPLASPETLELTPMATKGKQVTATQEQVTPKKPVATTSEAVAPRNMQEETPLASPETVELTAPLVSKSGLIAPKKPVTATSEAAAPQHAEESMFLTTVSKPLLYIISIGGGLIAFLSIMALMMKMKRRHRYQDYENLEGFEPLLYTSA